MAAIASGPESYPSPGAIISPISWGAIPVISMNLLSQIESPRLSTSFYDELTRVLLRRRPWGGCGLRYKSPIAGLRWISNLPIITPRKSRCDVLLGSSVILGEILTISAACSSSVLAWWGSDATCLDLERTWEGVSGISQESLNFYRFIFIFYPCTNKDNSRSGSRLFISSNFMLWMENAQLGTQRGGRRVKHKLSGADRSD